MNSLRSRLLTAMVGSIALLLLLFGVVIYAEISQALRSEFDAALLATARAVAASSELDDGEIEIEFDPAKASAMADARTPFFFQVWLGDGTALLYSESLGENGLPRFHGEGSKPLWRNLRVKGDIAVRALGIQFAPTVEGKPSQDEAAEKVTLVVARGTAHLAERLATFRWLLIVTGIATMAAAFVVSFAVVGRGLRPLDQLADSLGAIDEENLAYRLPDDGLPAELTPVVARLNSLLARLDTAFARERGFSADIAHELRTPLAGIRTTLDVALSRTRSAAEYEEALTDTQAIATRMGALVERLLLLSRLETHDMKWQKERVAVAELVDSCWQPLADRARERGLTFTNSVAPELACVADSGCLVMAFTNILENAAEYTDEGGTVEVSAVREGTSVRIDVTNTGCTLTQTLASQVFDRLWRGDTSRADTGLHAGLGLALVQRVIASLEGHVESDVLPGGYFRLRVVLPAADSDGES